MNKKTLALEVERLEQYNQERKNRAALSSITAKWTYLCGWAFIIIFISYLVITHYLILSTISTIGLLLGLPSTSILFSSMSAQYFGLFLLALLGLTLVTLAKLSIIKNQQKV